ncbi:uncharacterized protein dlp [Periplaneta americana]|uniref:uncharacterized protein dlp n=1 Tax=Periplaneta americana TaxID=6978 RepID=UPI0037E9A4C0
MVVGGRSSRISATGTGTGCVRTGPADLRFRRQGGGLLSPVRQSEVLRTRLAPFTSKKEVRDVGPRLAGIYAKLGLPAGGQSGASSYSRQPGAFWLVDTSANQEPLAGPDCLPETSFLDVKGARRVLRTSDWRTGESSYSGQPTRFLSSTAASERSSQAALGQGGSRRRASYFCRPGGGHLRILGTPEVFLLHEARRPKCHLHSGRSELVFRGAFSRALCSKSSMYKLAMAGDRGEPMATPVPLKESLELLKPQFPPEVIGLFNHTLSSTYFMYKGQYYEQSDGVAMGSPLSPAVANLYMEDFEHRALENAPLKTSSLVVEDTLVVWPHGEEKFQEFQEYLNNIHPNIQFTKEVEKDGCLPFLDILISRKSDGTLGHRVYRKPTHTDLYLNGHSHHHPAQKRTVLSTLLHRARGISDKESLPSEICHLRKTFLQNNFGNREIGLALRSAFSDKPPAEEQEETKGMAYIPLYGPISGEHLRVCPQGLTCCTEEMEHHLSAQSRQEFDRAVRDTLNKLGTLLKIRAQRFDGFFKELLATSKREFHDMFKRTYGIIYEQNSYVFTDLFEELERYYAKGQVDLGEAMENFFSTLYQKMFTVLNAQYDFDDKYLGCVGEHMKELKPFGDVPHKLSVQLKRSFVATRTFSQALNVASEVVNNMVKINPSPECVRALTKMTGCPACQGLPELKACSNYCINVMKGCLAYQAELDSDWNNFVDAMEKVTDRLLGPFNIEMVVEPIDIKISEAIMNFQENGPEVSQRVFSGCGKPSLGRRRRDTTELEFESLQFGRSDDDQNGQNNFVPTLDKLVKDIKLKIKDTKQFWSHLPYQICNDDHVAASPAKDDSCWNGAMKARYELQITGDGISNQQANPEVVVDVNRPSSLLNEQMYALKTITSKLKNAYNGLDVEWIDIEESSYGSGSGSGDGSDSDDDFEGSGDTGHFGYGHGPGTGGSGLKPYLRPTNKDDNNLHPGVPGGEMDRHRPRNSTSGGTSATAKREISVTRAVTSYLLPIVVMWFGGIFSDWL